MWKIGKVVVGATLGFLVKHVSASIVVSGTTSRLPMALSTILNDLEAEGATSVTTAAVVASASVDRSSLLRKLFGISGEGDHDDEVQDDGSTTAFGKTASHAEEGGVGLAVATCSSSLSCQDAASTAVACGGTVVLVVNSVDLDRGEGLFSSLAPAMERLLALGSSSDASLLVVVEGASSSSDLQAAKAKLERAASAMLVSAIVQAPEANNGKNAMVLKDVFGKGVEYVSDSQPIDDMLSRLGGTRAFTDAAASVSSSVSSDNTDLALLLTAAPPSLSLSNSPKELAAARSLGPVARSALRSAMTAVLSVTGGFDTESSAEPQLVTNFGSLCDAAVKRALDEFDTAVGSVGKKKNTAGSSLATTKVAKKLRADLVEAVYAELADVYEAQLKQLSLACFESFQRGLSGLKVSPNLGSDMQGVLTDSMKEFKSKLPSLKAASANHWPSADATKSELRQQMQDYNTERLTMARASGQFRPAPRKGFGIGFHWLLPKPFGNDYRLEPWDVHTKENLVYVPPDKVTDVDATSGDWRNSIVPSPSGNELIYMQ
eukprot:scaffold114011_cov49-Attheya_sp.AAC.2